MKNSYLNITGLREKPQDMNKEQPYHMTSVLRRLFPHNTPRIGKGLVDKNGESVYKMVRKTLYPDFLYTDLGMIIEIDGDSSNSRDGHFTSKVKAENDLLKIEQYRKLGYKVIAIPPYIQLDKTMIEYYFGIECDDLLYPAATEHGFAHPDIPLPSSFCKIGLNRFIDDMKKIPSVVRDKIIETLKERIHDFEEEGFSKDDAVAKVLPPSAFYMLNL